MYHLDMNSVVAWQWNKASNYVSVVCASGPQESSFSSHCWALSAEAPCLIWKTFGKCGQGWWQRLG